jgi:hypothetical protein
MHQSTAPAAALGIQHLQLGHSAGQLLEHSRHVSSRQPHARSHSFAVSGTALDLEQRGCSNRARAFQCRFGNVCGGRGRLCCRVTLQVRVEKARFEAVSP